MEGGTLAAKAMRHIYDPRTAMMMSVFKHRIRPQDGNCFFGRAWQCQDLASTTCTLSRPQGEAVSGYLGPPSHQEQHLQPTPACAFVVLYPPLSPFPRQHVLRPCS